MPRAAHPTPAAVLAPSPPHLFAGTSGWAYPTWRPAFYPEGTPARALLAYYASVLTSVEVNYTFRKLPTPAQIDTWLAATPPGFRFSFKAPQRITHFARLQPTDAMHASLAAFLAAIAPVHAAARLGPLLFQLPPNFKADPERLAAFLESPTFADARQRTPALHLAFEFRHPSWFTEDTYAVLRRANAALCVAGSGDLITPDIATASFRYYRLRHTGGYTAAQLKAFAKRFTALAATAEIFLYLKHEDEPTGALNALALLRAANNLTPTKPPVVKTPAVKARA